MRTVLLNETFEIQLLLKKEELVLYANSFFKDTSCSYCINFHRQAKSPACTAGCFKNCREERTDALNDYCTRWC